MEPCETLGISSDYGLEEMKQAYAGMTPARHSDKTGRYVRNDKATRVFSSANEAYRGPINDHMNGCKRRALPSPISVPQRSSSGVSAASTFVPSPLSIGSFDSISTAASSIAENLDEIRSPRSESREHHSPKEAHAWKSHQSDGLNSATQSSTLVEVDGGVGFRLWSGDGLRGKQHQNGSPPLTSEKPSRNTRPFLVTAGPALQPLGRNESGKWTYSLAVTLEDLFHGLHSQFGIVRRLRSGQTKNVVIDLDIPPGCRTGTQILCREVGNELPTGKLEDVILVIEELPHRLYRRMGDDLLMDVQIPWSNDLKQHPKKIDVANIDKEVIEVFIDYSREKSFSGSLSVRNAGMPIRKRGNLTGRGRLIVRWEILPSVRGSGIHGVLSRFFRHGTHES